ncbi:hypothetical protein MUP65_02205, partial [Patescibacteria group bacterium]|nr:hypothetical protein [Patescibacteria group bacterium]
MKKLLLSLLAVAAVLSVVVEPVGATVNCWTDYGGDEICERTGDLYLDKRVSTPRDNNEGDLIFKDHLDESGERYINGQEAVFGGSNYSKFSRTVSCSYVYVPQESGTGGIKFILATIKVY